MTNAYMLDWENLQPPFWTLWRGLLQISFCRLLPSLSMFVTSDLILEVTQTYCQAHMKEWSSCPCMQGSLCRRYVMGWRTYFVHQRASKLEASAACRAPDFLPQEQYQWSAAHKRGHAPEQTHSSCQMWWESQSHKTVAVMQIWSHITVIAFCQLACVAGCTFSILCKSKGNRFWYEKSPCQMLLCACLAWYLLSWKAATP